MSSTITILICVISCVVLGYYARKIWRVSDRPALVSSYLCLVAGALCTTVVALSVSIAPYHVQSNLLQLLLVGGAVTLAGLCFFLGCFVSDQEVYKLRLWVLQSNNLIVLLLVSSPLAFAIQLEPAVTQSSGAEILGGIGAARVVLGGLAWYVIISVVLSLAYCIWVVSPGKWKPGKLLSEDFFRARIATRWALASSAAILVITLLLPANASFAWMASGVGVGSVVLGSTAGYIIMHEPRLCFAEELCLTHRLMTLSDGRSDAVRPELIGHLSSQLHVMLGGDAVASQASTDTSARVSSVPSDNVPATVHSLSLSNMRLDDATGLLAEESSALDGLSLQVSNAPIEPPPRDPDSVPMGWEQGLNYEALGLKEDNARLYNILHTVLRHREDLDQPFAVPGDLTFDACKLDEYQDLIERNKALNQRLFGRAILAFSAELRQALFEARSFVGQASLLLVSGPDGGEQREIEQIVLSQFDPERQLHVNCRELNERVSLVHNVAEFFDQSPARSLVAISEAEFLSVTDVRALARLTSALDPTRRLVLLRTDVSEPDCGVSSVLIPRIDVEPLASRCIDLFFRLIESVEVECRAQGVNSKDISISALHEALVYHWPGNTSEVREVCRSAVAASGDTISSFGLISA